MKIKNRQIIPHARLRELREAENAHLAAMSPYKDDWIIQLFKTRKAMQNFCKHGSQMHALIKDRVASGMLINRNMQRVAR